MNNKFDNLEIAADNQQISYGFFMKRLFELHYDCNHEHYLSEVFVPFFQMCSTDNTKIVPIFDDRSCGPRTDNETESKRRMKTICAKKENGEYVVPDYIYVPSEYSFANPQKPYLMVETKNPVLIIREETHYRDLSHYVIDNQTELRAEIEACGYVVFTDGITWMFLEERDGEIVESDTYGTIRLVNKFESYYKTNRISMKYGIVQMDLSFMNEGVYDVAEEPEEWNVLKNRITELLQNLSK